MNLYTFTTATNDKQVQFDVLYISCTCGNHYAAAKPCSMNVSNTFFASKVIPADRCTCGAELTYNGGAKRILIDAFVEEDDNQVRLVEKFRDVITGPAAFNKTNVVHGFRVTQSKKRFLTKTVPVLQLDGTFEDETLRLRPVFVRSKRGWSRHTFSKKNGGFYYRDVTDKRRKHPHRNCLLQDSAMSRVFASKVLHHLFGMVEETGYVRDMAEMVRFIRSTPNLTQATRNAVCTLSLDFDIIGVSGLGALAQLVGLPKSPWVLSRLQAGEMVREMMLAMRICRKRSEFSFERFQRIASALQDNGVAEFMFCSAIKDAGTSDVFGPSRRLSVSDDMLDLLEKSVLSFNKVKSHYVDRRERSLAAKVRNGEMSEVEKESEMARIRQTNLDGYVSLLFDDTVRMLGKLTDADKALIRRDDRKFLHTLHDAVSDILDAKDDARQLPLKLDSVVMDDIELRQPETAKQLKDIGRKMGHCVGSYVDEVIEGRCLIVAAYADGDPVVCLEIRNDWETPCYAICQAKLSRNAPVKDSAKLNAFVLDYAKRIGAVIRTSDVDAN